MLNKELWMKVRLERSNELVDYDLFQIAIG